MAVTLQGVMRFMVGLAITAAILFLIWYFSSVVIYILVSAVLAIMGRPVVSWLLKIRISGRTMPRWAAASITLVVIMAVLLGILSLFIPLIFSKINEFAHLDFASVLASVEEPIAHAQAYMQRTFAMPETSFSLTDTLATKIKELINYDTLNNTFTSILNVALSTLISIFSISFITFFFLKEDGLFYSMVTAMFPERLQQNVTRALDSITYLLSRYFTGLLTESLIISTIIAIVLFLFGMNVEDACFIAVIMGMLNVIPYAGPAVGVLV
ncbi:MAG: AI-2E family transporter, partial [Alistipes sp.]|nr:AI-2E family transporter [Alistipes sp.]